MCTSLVRMSLAAGQKQSSALWPAFWHSCLQTKVRPSSKLIGPMEGSRQEWERCETWMLAPENRVGRISGVEGRVRLFLLCSLRASSPTLCGVTSQLSDLIDLHLLTVAVLLCYKTSCQTPRCVRVVNACVVDKHYEKHQCSICAECYTSLRAHRWLITQVKT
ncbi:hypothetical protein IQ06DRAFT_155019 [Phaeosphaeriaceae sp. SRC1lsM3a]|nr:hypothetical protein IQ06DRAFT_155019 [Stagonospora sp. SRC1lsM3a]